MEGQKKLFGSIMTHNAIAGLSVPATLQDPGHSCLRKLFRMYQTTSYLFLLTILVGQFAALYRYWGDTVIVLETIGSTAGTVVALWGQMCPMILEERIHRAVERMETKSVLALPVVHTHPRLKEIIDRVQRKLSWVCLGVRISIVCSILFWIVSPFVIRYLQGHPPVCHGHQNRTMTPQELLQNDGFDQFCLVMWMPIDAKKWYSYLLALQLICYLLALKNLITFSVMMVYFFVFTAAELELIGALVLLVDADEEEKLRISATRTDAMPIFSKKVKDSPEEQSPTVYLKEIIKLHQAALEAADDLNVTQAIALSGGLGSLIVMIITSMVEITLVPSLTPKFLCVILACFLQVFIFTLFGETIFNQSESVGEIAYSTKWYERPKEFQQLIYMVLMRTASPTAWYMCGTILIKLTAFADITIVCYRVFMLMLEFETDTDEALCLE